MEVIYFIQGEDIEIRGHVDNATDFLQTLKLVDNVTVEKEWYQVINTELVVCEDGQPYLAIFLEG